MSKTIYGQSFRGLPRHGEPTSKLEWVSQKTIKGIARFPIYVILICFLTTAAWAWLLPLVEACV